MTKPKKINTEKFHIAIDQCLRDLEWAEKSPKHEINMGYWCVKDVSGVCSVCLGGAAMAHRYGMSGLDELRAKIPNDREKAAVQCMDDVRKGNLVYGYEEFTLWRPETADIKKNMDHVQHIERKLQRHWHRYNSSQPKPFKVWLKMVIKELRKLDI